MRLQEPLDVLDMHNLIARSFMVLTDSVGLQEEAPFWGKPVLVLRTETVRPEAVEAGTVKVADNPYGDGHASERITGIILKNMTC